MLLIEYLSTFLFKDGIESSRSFVDSCASNTISFESEYFLSPHMYFLAPAYDAVLLLLLNLIEALINPSFCEETNGELSKA